MFAKQKQAALQILKQRGEMSGRDLRTLMREGGVKMGLASFYFMMSELHESGQVERRTEAVEVDGVEIKRFCFKTIQTEQGENHDDNHIK